MANQFPTDATPPPSDGRRFCVMCGKPYILSSNVRAFDCLKCEYPLIRSGLDSQQQLAIEQAEWKNANKSITTYQQPSQDDGGKLYSSSWFHAYRQNPSSLEDRATVVAETEDSRGRRRGGAPDRTVFLEQNPYGAFWIICDNGNDYLVLKANVTVNKFNQDSFKACFDNLLPGQVGKQPQISRPARVQSTGGRWQLVEKGAFASNINLESKASPISEKPKSASILTDNSNHSQNIPTVLTNDIQFLKRQQSALLESFQELQEEFRQVQVTLSEIKDNQTQVFVNTSDANWMAAEDPQSLDGEGAEIDLESRFDWLAVCDQVMNLAYGFVKVDLTEQVTFISDKYGGYVIFRDTTVNKYYLLPTKSKQFHAYNLSIVKRFFTIKTRKEQGQGGKFKVVRPVEVKSTGLGDRWQVIQNGELLMFEEPD